MKTIGFAALVAALLALSPNVGGAFLDRIEQEVSASNMPTSRQQVERQVMDGLGFNAANDLIDSIG